MDSIRRPVFLLSLAGLVAALDLFGATIGLEDGSIPLFRPASGLVLAVLLMSRSREWPAILATALVAAAATGWMRDGSAMARHFLAWSNHWSARS